MNEIRRLEDLSRQSDIKTFWSGDITAFGILYGPTAKGREDIRFPVHITHPPTHTRGIHAHKTPDSSFCTAKHSFPFQFIHPLAGSIIFAGSTACDVMSRNSCELDEEGHESHHPVGSPILHASPNRQLRRIRGTLRTDEQNH